MILKSEIRCKSEIFFCQKPHVIVQFDVNFPLSRFFSVKMSIPHYLKRFIFEYAAIISALGREDRFEVFIAPIRVKRGMKAHAGTAGSGELPGDRGEYRLIAEAGKFSLKFQSAEMGVKGGYVFHYSINISYSPSARALCVTLHPAFFA